MKDVHITRTQASPAINYHTSTHTTTQAANHGHYDVCELLLKHNAPADASQSLPLVMASSGVCVLLQQLSAPLAWC